MQCKTSPLLKSCSKWCCDIQCLLILIFPWLDTFRLPFYKSVSPEKSTFLPPALTPLIESGLTECHSIDEVDFLLLLPSLGLLLTYFLCLWLPEAAADWKFSARRNERRLGGGTPVDGSKILMRRKSSSNLSLYADLLCCVVHEAASLSPFLPQ